MAFLVGVQISNTYKIPYGLKLLYGLGLQSALKVCYAIGVNKNNTFSQLTANQRVKLKKYLIENCILEGALKKKKKLNINRLIENKSYRGKRHSLNLPVRGQRTHTNARTVKKIKL